MIPEIICDFDPWGCLQFAESIFHLRVTFAGEREGGKRNSPLIALIPSRSNCA